MRILLVNPPGSDKNMVNDYTDMDLTKFYPVGAPQSLCAMAGNLREYDVEIVDFKAEFRLGLFSDLEEAMEKKIQDFNPDIVGITVVTSEYNYALQILETVKRYNPAILTVVGGVHVTLCPKDFERSVVDVAIFGHGKKIFRDLVMQHIKKEDFYNIENIAVQKNGKFYYTKKESIFKKPCNLCSEVFADRALVRKYIDAYRVGEDKAPLGFIETSYGCPNKCTFCSIWPMNKGQYHIRDAEHIIREMRLMNEYKAIRFVDANTMGNLKHIETVLDRIIKEKFDYKYVMDIRSDTIANNEELVKKASEAGVIIAIVGLETIDEEELKKYNKEATLYTNLKAIEVFHKYNISMRASFIIHPDYNENNFNKIKHFVKENDLKHAVFSVMTPIPGTPLYAEYKDKIIIKDLSYYNLLNSVLPTKLPLDNFYKQIAALYVGQKGVRQ